MKKIIKEVAESDEPALRNGAHIDRLCRAVGDSVNSRPAVSSGDAERRDFLDSHWGLLNRDGYKVSGEGRLVSLEGMTAFRSGGWTGNRGETRRDCNEELSEGPSWYATREAKRAHVGDYAGAAGEGRVRLQLSDRQGAGEVVAGQEPLPGKG